MQTEEIDEEFGLFDEAVAGDVLDPYPEFARTRRETPVQRLDASGMPHDESQPLFMVYNHDDVAEVLRDNETFSSAIIRDIWGQVMGKDIILGMDRPEHGRHRALVSTAFRQKTLARWENELVHS